MGLTGNRFRRGGSSWHQVWGAPHQLAITSVQPWSQLDKLSMNFCNFSPDYLECTRQLNGLDVPRHPAIMSLLETVALEHVPATHSVHVAFFKGVANAGYLQSQLLARNADFEYAFIDATTVVSRLQVLAAAYKALSVLLDGRLKSPNVHAETVLALSASNNVSPEIVPCYLPLWAALTTFACPRSQKHTAAMESRPKSRTLSS